MSWDNFSLNMKYLMASPIKFDGIGTLSPITINEIMQIGYDAYNQYLGFLCISTEDIENLLDVEFNDENRIEPFVFLFENARFNESSKNDLVSALEFFFKEKVTFEEDGYFIIGLEGVLHNNNFNFVIDILKGQNCIDTSDTKISPKNEKEKEYYKQVKKMKEKYKVKDSSDLTDIISSVCAKHPTISLFNVGGLTIYQLIDQYRRLNQIDNYYISIDSLLHGAEKNDVEVLHWSEKMKKIAN